MTADPFGTSALRGAVLDAWRGSGTRLREDANLEEDHARGYYRDRVLVELAQNAADAAARAGVPGRVTVRLEGHRSPAVLVVSNDGAPLDAAGVASLASLRASAKGAGAVGRFGVGFAAVRGVADDVTVRSRAGGVRFSLTATLEALGLREGHVPVLRLPFPAPATTPAEPDTVVELVLRDAEALEAVRTQLDAVDDALLLALPSLDEVTLEHVDARGERHRRVLRDVEERWTVHREAGELDPADVADLPAEHRRTDWSVVWALPRGGEPARGPVPGLAAATLHAPTPTDVPLSFPALLVASFPVDPGRRRVLPGPATERLAVAAGRAYAALLARLAPERGGDVLELVPAGMPAGDLDAVVRDAAVDALRTAPLLPAADAGGAGLVAPADAVLLAGPVGEDREVARVLGAVALTTRLHALARMLGARVVPLADALDELPGGMAPARWREVYAALAAHVVDPAVREALAGVRVPLADGRLVLGPRGTVLPDGPHGAGRPEEDDEPSTAGERPGAHDPLADAAAALGVRLVHPDAAHPVLERAGAVELDPRALLGDPSVRAAALAAAAQVIDDDGDDDGGDDEQVGAGPQDVVDAVLLLARLAVDGSDAPLPFWLGELPVATADRDVAPLRECALPGSWAAEHLDALALLDVDEVVRHGAHVLRAAGAHADLDLYVVRDVDTGGGDDPGPDDPAGWLAGWDDYLDALAERWGEDVLVGDLEAVADLDAVAEGSWSQALTRVAGDPLLRRALLAPARPGAGARPGAEAAPSYTAWWLRRHLGAPFALDGDVPLLPAPPAPVRGLDPEVLRALGGVGSLAGLTSEDWPVVLEGLPPVGAPVALTDALALWEGLVALAVRLGPHTEALDPLPGRLPALRTRPAEVTPDVTVQVTVADASDLVVAGAPRWSQTGPVVPAPPGAAAALADLLDLPLAGGDGGDDESDIEGDLVPDAPGALRDVDERVRALDPRLPHRWRHHERLTVGGRRVTWWVHDGQAHAEGTAGLARALAEVLGAPSLGPVLERALAEPARAQEVWAVRAWG
ncbi:ATP-binding protein [Xylanimonas oleitrophica]|uniref:ATP-binding protein n=1 Tax=Xylanimonas oleitrophica TaxID=2607479 RepID=A0A2W5XUT9_9MICO|nr:ATP-binding protein [Xylanimonas oleitrophica]PZR54108.1 ATP-binding protein [Xylanimonas oleitrophica]